MLPGSCLAKKAVLCLSPEKKERGVGYCCAASPGSPLGPHLPRGGDGREVEGPQESPASTGEEASEGERPTRS